MTVQLTLLKSGEEVITDIKEYRNSDGELISYLFKNPYTVKIQNAQLLVEEESAPKYEALFYRWISLSKDNDIIVNKDWIVSIVEPIDSIKKSYEEKINGRRDDDESANGRGSDDSSSSSIIFNE